MLAELLLGRPIFAGDNSVNQLVEVIKQLGSPTREQLGQMNPNYKDTRFPEMRARPWQKVSENAIAWWRLCGVHAGRSEFKNTYQVSL